MNKDELKTMLQTTVKESVAETIAEVEQEAIDEIKGALPPVLQKRKQALMERLQKEIAETNSLGVKVRDYLYIILVRIMDKLYVKIENQLGM